MTEVHGHTRTIITLLGLLPYQCKSPEAHVLLEVSERRSKNLPPMMAHYDYVMQRLGDRGYSRHGISFAALHVRRGHMQSGQRAFRVTAKDLWTTAHTTGMPSPNNRLLIISQVPHTSLRLSRRFETNLWGF